MVMKNVFSIELPAIIFQMPDIAFASIISNAFKSLVVIPVADAINGTILIGA